MSSGFTSDWFFNQIRKSNKTQVVELPTPSARFLITRSTDEVKLNKTEREYLMMLRARSSVVWLGIQSITLKLGFDLRFTADFVVLEDEQLTFIDTKGGFIREDSTIKIKTAAHFFPMFRFLVAQKTKTGWKEKVIQP